MSFEFKKIGYLESHFFFFANRFHSMLELEGFVGHVDVLIWKKGGVHHKGTLGKGSYCLSGACNVHSPREALQSVHPRDLLNTALPKLKPITAAYCHSKCCTL